MSKNWSRLTVFFEAPFWVGVYQRAEEGALSVCKITFGAEPSSAEVYQYLLGNWHRLPFGPALPGQAADEGFIKNPKRRQRQARRQTEANRGVGTRAQQILQMQRQAGKRERQRQCQAQREERQCRKFDLRRQKRREKHKGH